MRADHVLLQPWLATEGPKRFSVAFEWQVRVPDAMHIPGIGYIMGDMKSTIRTDRGFHVTRLFTGWAGEETHKNVISVFRAQFCDF